MSDSFVTAPTEQAFWQPFRILTANLGILESVSWTNPDLGVACLTNVDFSGQTVGYAGYVTAVGPTGTMFFSDEITDITLLHQYMSWRGLLWINSLETVTFSNAATFGINVTASGWWLPTTMAQF